LNSTACCAPDVVRVAIAATVGVSSTSTSATISGTSSPATTGTGTSASGSATPPASPSNNGKIRLAVGLGVGGICLLVGTIAASCLVLRKRRREQEKYGSMQSGNGDPREHIRPVVLPKVEWDTKVHERAELDSGNHQKTYEGNVVYHEVHA
jgi:hypothetical protein